MLCLLLFIIFLAIIIIKYRFRINITTGGHEKLSSEHIVTGECVHLGGANNFKSVNCGVCSL
jgi:hypothetical protein